MDRLLFHLIRVGYPLFAFNLLLGLFWVWYQPELLGDGWWLSPKIVLSVFAAAFFALCFHARMWGWLRGPKLARFIFVGFSSLLVVYLCLSMLRLSNYNFWDAGV